MSSLVVWAVSLNFVAVSLLVVASALTWATIWFWTSARPEPESLAPLEVMSQRDFSDADDAERKQMLNSVRTLPIIDLPAETPKTN